jgi:hypothetical protein
VVTQSLSQGAGTCSYESRASRYLFDLSREVQATTRALESQTRSEVSSIRLVYFFSQSK